MTYLKQSTAVDIGFGPFLDETDGKTAETALTITQPDIRLKKNGGNWAQKNAAQTLSHEENGWYEISLDTTDTNTLGILIVAVHESGALPVWREFMVLPAMIYDSIVAGSDRLDTNVTHIADTSQTARDIGASVLVGDKTGFSLSAGGVQAIWDALSAALTTANSIGKRIVDYLTGDIYARVGAPAGASVSADVAAVKSDSAAIKTVTDGLAAKLDAINYNKNTAYSNYMFLMVDATDGYTPETGLTPTCTRSIDGAAFASCANSPTEVGSGWYKINLAAADMNGDEIVLRFTGTGSRNWEHKIRTISV